MSECDIELTTLQQCVGEEKTRQRSLEKQHQEHTRKLHGEMNQAKAEYSNAYDRVKQLHDELSASVSLLRTSEKEKDQLERALKHAESVRATMQQETKVLKADHDMISSNNHQLEEVLTAVKTQMQQMSAAHRQEVADLSAEADQADKECTLQRNEVLKLRLILVNIGSAVEHHIEGRSQSHSLAGSPAPPKYQSLYDDTPEEKRSGSGRYSLYSELQTPQPRGNLRSMDKDKDTGDQAIAAMVCKLLAENVRLTQDNQELIAKHNTVAEDMSALKARNNELQMHAHEYQRWLGEVDAQIEELEDRLADEAMGSRLPEQLQRDWERQADPKGAGIEPAAAPTPDHKAARSTTTAGHKSGRSPYRSPSPSPSPSPSLAPRPEPKRTQHASGKQKHPPIPPPPALQSHDLRHARLSRVTEGLSGLKKRLQFVMTKNAEQQDVISNLELQAVRTAKEAETRDQEHECRLRDARLQHERKLRETMDQYYRQLEELRCANQEAEAAVNAVTRESERELAMAQAESRGLQKESQEVWQMEHHRKLEQIEEDHSRHSEQALSVLLFVLFHYLRLKERYSEVVVQKGVITAQLRRQEASVRESLAELGHRHETRVANMTGCVSFMRERLAEGETEGDVEGGDWAGRADGPSPRARPCPGPLDEEELVSAPPPLKPQRPRRMTLRLAGLIVVAVCHMKKLVQNSRARYRTVRGRDGDFLQDLLQASSCSQAVQDLVGETSAKGTAGPISSSALARGNQIMLQTPVVLAFIFLNGDAGRGERVTQLKNEIICRFCNAIPVSAVPAASSSYFTAQTASLLKSIKYSYRSGSQTHFRPLCVPLAIGDDAAADELVADMKRLALAWATGYQKLRDEKEQTEALLEEASASNEKYKRTVAALRTQKRGEEQEILNVLGKLNVVHSEFPSNKKSPKFYSNSNLNVPSSAVGTISPASGKGGTGIHGDIRDDYMQCDAESLSVGSESISGRRLEGTISSRSVSPRVTAVNASRSMYSALYVSPYSQTSTTDSSSRKREKSRK